MRRDSYDEYIHSETWARLKRNHPARKECIACYETERRRLHLHHKFYRPNIWDTQPEDCCWLCENCHEFLHEALFAMGFGSNGPSDLSSDDLVWIIDERRAEYYADAAYGDHRIGWLMYGGCTPIQRFLLEYAQKVSPFKCIKDGWEPPRYGPFRHRPITLEPNSRRIADELREIRAERARRVLSRSECTDEDREYAFAEPD